jgi:hypothetical protein
MPQILRCGDVGNDVCVLQSMLNAQPTSIEQQPLAEDGRFGSLTQAQTIAYQRLNGLSPDGVVGPFTWAKLKSRVRLVPTSPEYRCRMTTADKAPFDWIHLLASRPVPSFGFPTHASDVTVVTIGDFLITTDAKMPVVTALQVQLEGIDLRKTRLFIDWTVSVIFDPVAWCTFAKPGSKPFVDTFSAPHQEGDSFSPSSWAWDQAPAGACRGGDLTITGQTMIPPLPSQDVRSIVFVGRITGENPGVKDIEAALGSITMRQIANVESGFQQFEVDAKKGNRVVPRFNHGDVKRPPDGGAGICQITPPSADDIWNWKANVQSGKQKFNQAQSGANTYLNQHRDDHGGLPNDRGLGSTDVRLMDAIQRYNTGSKPFWQWNDNPKRWESKPPNNYVQRVQSASPGP